MKANKIKINKVKTNICCQVYQWKIQLLSQPLHSCIQMPQIYNIIKHIITYTNLHTLCIKMTKYAKTDEPFA